MYIKESRSRRNGRVHKTYQIVESYRDENGKVRQRILLHLGPAHKFLEKDIDTLINGLLRIKGLRLEDVTQEADAVYRFGQIWALMYLWKELKISQAIARQRRKRNIQYDLEAHLRALVFNRLDDPSSKLGLIRWLEEVYLPGIRREEIRYEYLLRAMDFLIEHKRAIEDAIARRLLTIFDRELKLCFYDLTSTYFEAEASLEADDIRQFGYSRDGRPDREQIVVGVVMTEDGLPIAHYVFPGNTADRATLQEVMQDIRSRFGAEEITLVADKGMISSRNLAFLLDSGFGFILGESPRQSRVAREVVREAQRARREQAPEAEVFLYETEKTRPVQFVNPSTGKVEKREVVLRYIASYRQDRAERHHGTRTRRIAEALEEIERMQNSALAAEDRYAQILGYLRRKHLSRFFTVRLGSERVHVVPREEELAFETEADGWALLVTPDRTIPKEEAVERYGELKYVEHGFLELKHSLELRPNFHWTEKRIRAHVMVCFLAFQLAVLFEKPLEHLRISWQRAMQKLRKIHVIEWSRDGRKVRALVHANREQLDLFRAVGAKRPTLMDL